MEKEPIGQSKQSSQVDLAWVERTGNNAWYWRTVAHIAKAIKSDGCTGVPDFYARACLEHDVHYRCHTTIWGTPITKAEADWILHRRIQQWSALGWFSPMSWWRWWVLRGFVHQPWDKGGKYHIEMEGRLILVFSPAHNVVLIVKMEQI